MDALHLRRPSHALRPVRRRALDRPDRRSRGLADQGPDGPAPIRRLGCGRRRGVRLRESGGGGQPERGADGAAARRSAAGGSRIDGEPVMRIQSRRDRDRRAGDRRRRSGADRGRRRRGDDPRPVRHGQGGCGILPQRGPRRHDDGVALRQSGDACPVRRGYHAGDGGALAAEHGIARADQDAFACRSQQRAAAASRDGLLRKRDRSGDDHRQEGHDDRDCRGRAPAS